MKLSFVPEFISGLFAKFVEFYLLREHVEWYVHGATKSPPALIVIQDGVKRWAVAIEKVLVPENKYSR